MILDTNAVSALAEQDPELIRLLDRATPPSLSFICIAEFQFGLLGSSRPQPGIDFLQRLAAAVPVLFPDPAERHLDGRTGPPAHPSRGLA